MDTFLDDYWTDTLLKKKSNPWFLHLHSYLYHQEIMIYCATEVSSVDVDLPILEVSLFERTESRGESVKYYCLADAQKFILTRRFDRLCQIFFRSRCWSSIK